MRRKTYLVPHYSHLMLVGCGGTGSYFAQGLAKMIAGYKLDTSVLLIDPEFVEEKNCARQNYMAYEIGQPKAESLSSRLNQQYATQFMFASGRGEDYLDDYHPSNRLIVTCVDSLEARRHYKKKGAWLDMGNGEETGQAVFGTSCSNVNLDSQLTQWDDYPHVGYLPCPYTVADMGNRVSSPDVPSCADHPFTEQGVFANEWAAQAGLSILHQLFIKKQLSTPHIYFDTARGRMTPGFITKEIFNNEC